MMRRAIVLALLAGCATAENYDRELQSLVGHPEAEVVRRFGAPHGIYESSGVKFLTYRTARNIHFPGWQGSSQTVSQGGVAITTPTGNVAPRVVERNCQTTFEVSGGLVSAYRFEGSGCRSK